MRPFTVILGIFLGSLGAIAFGLAVVALIFAILRSDYPRVANELPLLLRSAAIFALLSLLAGAAFLGSLRQRSWRYSVLTVFWAGLFATGWYYWP